MLQKLKILFVSAGDACRGQMARGWAQHLKGDLIEPRSAGIEPHGLDVYTVGVMAEAGVDISHYFSRSLQGLGSQEFDYLITLCDKAHEACPVLPGKPKVLHACFDDPSKLAARETNSVKALDHYRRVRDEIKALVTTLPDALIKLN